MVASSLMIRFFGYQEDRIFYAYCLDLNLAVQASSLEEARAKILDMAADYLHDALEGQDKAYQAQLLARKAPWPIFLKYYSLLIKHWVKSASQWFSESLLASDVEHRKLRAC
ncbi:MAG: DUF1902 domain-containing protein [Thiomicrospira sp.]|uniref:hypothetical protein n=1 Tax=Thiomicrospira sp. TaxID=935 RepID=UPI001A01AC10|nr:hypothetical protein [Thiomicrospira sp.]MBE0494572.1 DUF1902 domain-containing protein [Thiomicrospira sp.]